MLPRHGMGRLTPEEYAWIDSLTEFDARVVFADLIEHAMQVLASQSNEHNAAARSRGFENAEHEVLAFLSSERFTFLVDSLYQGNVAANELIQGILDKAYGPDVLTVVELDEPAPIVRRQGRRPANRGYTAPLVRDLEPGADALQEYERAIQEEQMHPDQLILELPGFTLWIEELTNEHTEVYSP